jgi:hypothetical protein
MPDNPRCEEESGLDAIIEADSPVGVPDQKETGKTLEMLFDSAEAPLMSRTILGDAFFPARDERKSGRRSLAHGCFQFSVHHLQERPVIEERRFPVAGTSDHGGKKDLPRRCAILKDA